MAPDPPGIPRRYRREPDLASEQAAREEARRLERAVEQVTPPPKRVRVEESAPVSNTNPFSLFPAAEAAKAKVSVSVLLILAVGAVCYWAGSARHEEKLQALAAKVQEQKVDIQACSKASRVEELMNNVARDQAAMHGRIMQINQDTQVILSNSKK